MSRSWLNSNASPPISSPLVDSGSSWDPKVCPDGKTCAQNCAIEAGGVDEYENTYGVTASDDALTLGFVTKTQYGSNVGSRNYLLDDESTYKMFKRRCQASEGKTYSQDRSN